MGKGRKGPEFVVSEEEDKWIKNVLTKLGARKPEEFMFFIISKGRPENVGPMQKHFEGSGIWPTWIVGRGEADAYKEKGARHAVAGGGLCASRNLAIEIAKSKNCVCVEMSDDLQFFQIIHHDGKYVKLSQEDANTRSKQFVWASPVSAARYIEVKMRSLKARLGGAYVNVNKGYAMMCPPVSTSNFCVGDFLVIDSTSIPRFDCEMTLKEDYDFTAQHLHTYGQIARLNRVFVKAKHYTNAGGAVAVRNDEREQYNIKILRRKWPGVFRAHPFRGPNEVRMYWNSKGSCSSNKIFRNGETLLRMNGYNVFVLKKHEEIKENLKNLGKPHNVNHVQEQIATLWKSVSEDEKTQYELQARVRNGEVFVDDFVEEDEEMLKNRISNSSNSSALTQSDPIRQKILLQVKRYLILTRLRKDENVIVSSNAASSWARQVENELYKKSASDLTKYVASQTLESRVCNITKRLFEVEQGNMDEVPWKFENREWCVHVDDINRVEIRKRLSEFVLSLPDKRLESKVLDRHVRCMEQIMYESCSDLTSYVDKSTLQSRMSAVYKLYLQQGDLRLWYASKFNKIRTDMLSVILNFESQQHNFEISLALKQKAIFLETILYTHSPDKDTYCEVNSLPTRLKNAQQYLESQTRQVNEKLEKVESLTKPEPFTKDEIKACILSHRLFSANQVKNSSSSRSSMMMMAKKKRKRSDSKKGDEKKPKKKRSWSVKPLRLMLDKSTITDLIDRNASIAFDPDYIKKGLSKARYNKYKVAKTCKEAMALGAKRADLKWDLSKGIAKAVEADTQNLIFKQLSAKRDEKMAAGIQHFERSVVTSKGGSSFETSKLNCGKCLFLCKCGSSSSSDDVKSGSDQNTTKRVRATSRKTMVPSSSSSLPASTGVQEVEVTTSLPQSKANVCDVVQMMIPSSSPPSKKPRVNVSIGGDGGHSSNSADHQ